MSDISNLFRIASLVPSLTELAIELGLRECMVARTGFCIHPSHSVKAIPKVGGTKDVNLEKLKRIAPTHVLVNVDENRIETVEAIRAWSNPPQIVVTHPLGPEDNLGLIAQFVECFGVHEGVHARASVVGKAMAEELALTQADSRSPRRVLYLIWREPWMTVARDTYISRMLARVGWNTVPDTFGGEAGAARYPVVRGDEPWLCGVQQVLLSSEPYRFGQEHFESAQQLCPNAAVRLVDGEMLSWYGFKAIAGLRYLREIADQARI